VQRPQALGSGRMTNRLLAAAVALWKAEVEIQVGRSLAIY
jgi:hypothetical protein